MVFELDEIGRFCLACLGMILKAQTTGDSRDPNLTAWQYETNELIPYLRGGSIEDRYPVEGWARDTGSDKLILVWEGQCKVVIEDTAHDIIPGDIILVPRGSKFFIDVPFERSIKCWLVNKDQFDAGQIEFLPIK